MKYVVIGVLVAVVWFVVRRVTDKNDQKQDDVAHWTSTSRTAADGVSTLPDPVPPSPPPGAAPTKQAGPLPQD